MNPWEFGWSAMAAIGQFIIAIIAIWAVLRPSFKKLSLDLVYIYEKQ